MPIPLESIDDLAVSDWLKLLPASCLRQYVASLAAQRVLSGLASGITVSDLNEEIEVCGAKRSERQRKLYSDLARATRNLRRILRGRDIRDLRPARSNWIVPDTVGFALEGKSRHLSRRTSHLCSALTMLSYDPGTAPLQRQALKRVSELIAASRSHPTWLYWYSPQTIALARRSSPDTLFDANEVATQTIRRLGLATTISISNWEESIGVVSRRLPLRLVMASNPSRRCIQLIGKLERFGVLTMGGLTVLSTDSLTFLNSVRLSTLEGCCSALKDGYQPRAF